MRSVQARLLTLALVSATGCGLTEVADDGGTDEIPAAVQVAFNESCATMVTCHGSGSPLVSFAAGASAAILDTDAGNGVPYVVIGDLEGSYIARKILGNDITGGMMPPEQQHVNDDVNKAIILGWIAGNEFSDETETGDPECFAIDDPAPVFVDNVWPALEQLCATSGCHLNSSSPLMGAGDLADPAVAYMNLVDAQDPQTMLDYVEPGDPDGSYIWHKLVGTYIHVMGGAGSQMPFGRTICDDDLTVIRQWILDGALEM